jgi:hypothetical protein
MYTCMYVSKYIYIYIYIHLVLSPLPSLTLSPLINLSHCFPISIFLWLYYLKLKCYSFFGGSVVEFKGTVIAKVSHNDQAALLEAEKKATTLGGGAFV